MSPLRFDEPQEMTEDLVIAAVNTHGLESLAVLETIIWTNIDAGTEQWSQPGFHCEVREQD